MDPYSFNYGHDDFWAELAGRVKPFLGDVESTLGRYWMDLIEAQFSRADFVAVSMATRYSSNQPRWYVVEWFEGAGGLYEHEEAVKAGESRESCLAYLFEQCTGHGSWPDMVEFDDEADRTTFSLRDSPFAVVYCVGSDRITDQATVRRIESTLVGLRRREAQSEFVKRLAGWPRLAAAKAENDRSPVEARNNRAVPAHFPCPAEWLISAESLLLKAGASSATMLDRQQLATAVFGAASWNHLCGLLPARKPKSDWWSLYAPTYVAVDGSPGGYRPRVYHGVVAAFLDFSARAAEALASGDVDTVTFTDSIPAYPAFLAHADLLSASPVVSMGPVTAVDPAADWEERVRLATRHQYIEGLQRLFMHGASLDTKLAVRAEMTGRNLLAVDGPWRFYVKEGHSQSTSFLIAELYDASGKKEGSAAVPLYKGDLYHFDGIDGLVLAYDYDGRSPGAILKGLSDETIRAVTMALQYREEPVDPTECFGWKEDERIAPAIDRLLRGMTPAGVARSF